MLPVGDPRLKGMNDTQWVFELEAMNVQEKQHYDDIRMISENVRRQVISMLGLNLLPVEDPETKLLRPPEDHECLPLVALIGRDDALQTIKTRQDEYQVQREVQKQLEASSPIRGSKKDTGVVELSPEELETFMQDEGDVEFENAPEDILKAMKWGGKESQMLLESLVLSKDDLGDDPLVEAPARTIGQVRNDWRSKKGKPEVQKIEVEEVNLKGSGAAAPKEGRQAVTLDVK